jgi:hypothetical protein
VEEIQQGGEGAVKTQKVRADLILKQLAKRHTGRQQMDDIFLAEVKNGRTWDNRETLRLDAIAIRKSWAKPLVVAYEIKVDRADFLRDTKWPKYLELCNEFYFACPNGLISEEEVEPTVGLIWYNPEKGCITTKRKAVYRRVEIPKDMLWYLIMARLSSDSRHPFFSSDREFFEAWVEEKKNKHDLGRRVQSKASEIISDLNIQVTTLQREIDRQEDNKKVIEEIRQVAINYGAHWSDTHHLAEFFEKALKKSLPPEMARLVSSIEKDAARLRGMVFDS